MDISGNRGVIGRAEGEAHSQRIEVESWSWGERGGPAGRRVDPDQHYRQQAGPRAARRLVTPSSPRCSTTR